MVKIVKNSDGTIMLFHNRCSALDHEKFSRRYETGKDIRSSMSGAPFAIVRGDDPRIVGYLSAKKDAPKTVGAVKVSARKEDRDEYDLNAMAVPPGVDLESNVAEASKHRFALEPLWFYNQVKTNGPWDFKNKFKGDEGKKYVDFGNYHYGAVGRAAGVPEEVLERLAGWNKVYEESNKRAGKTDATWGDKAKRDVDFWRAIPSAMGLDLDGSDDQPRDNWFIRKGIGYYENKYKPPHDVKKIGLDPNVPLSVPGYY